MTFEELDERYLHWLYSQVANVKVKPRTRTYWSLMRQIYETIFVALVPHDENRIADSRELRYEFLAECEDVEGDPEWIRLPATMLELLIVLARQLAFEMDDAPGVWFWHLIERLGLRDFTDSKYDSHAEKVVRKALDRVIWRTYSYDGDGGLFPLENPGSDQREVELWYQLNAYLMEQF